MNTSFTQTFLVTPVRQGVGLTSVALGIVRALQRLGVEVGFAKPIAQEDEDNSDHFAREIFQIAVPAALALADSAERIAANQTGQLLEDVVALCMNASQGAGVLVVEGLHTDAEHPFASQLNVDLARSLKAEVVLVADASLPHAVTESRLAASQFANEECRVAGVIFNKAPASFDQVSAQKKLGQIHVWGVVPENPILRAPRTLDVAQHLNAEVVFRGELDTRRVTEVVTAARSVPEVIPRLRPGVLVITSGDRDDVIIACALAASRGIELAGLLLTHASIIAPQVMEFAGPALTSGLPILCSADDSFGTARRVSHIPRTVPKDDIARMNTRARRRGRASGRRDHCRRLSPARKHQTLPAGLSLSTHPEGACRATTHRPAGRRRAPHLARGRDLRGEGHCPLCTLGQA